MKSFKNLVSVFTFSFLVLGLATIASAQWRNDDDYYGRGQNDQYGTYNRGQMRSAVERLKNRSKQFDKQLEKELKRNRGYNDRYYSDRILQLSEAFKDAANDLEDNFDKGNRNNRQYDDRGYVQQVLNLGRQLDREVYSARLSYNLENSWSAIQQDLRFIEQAYGYNSRNGNGRWGSGSRRGNTNGDWRNKVPFPLPF
jgi:hypothetical protein